MISIHAPQWGATVEAPPASMALLFQSTHPSGVRLVDGYHYTRSNTDFNPRTPVGCDGRLKDLLGAN